MTRDLLSEYFRSHDITLIDGLRLIEQAVKQATKSEKAIFPIERDNGEIEFYVQSLSGELRPIKMREPILKKIYKKLTNLVLDYQSAKEVYSLKKIKYKNEILKGVIDDQTINGWFVNLPNMRAFMPKQEAIEEEIRTGFYRADQKRFIYFSIISSSVEKSGKPRIILSRKNIRIATALAKNIFSAYGFITLKRQAGIKQTLFIRAYPQRIHQEQYRSYFPTERIAFRKLLPNGEIKRKDNQ